MKNIHIISKEQLNNILFYKNDVLDETLQRQLRKDKLQRALVLGNIEHNHVKITFKNREGDLQQVEATIWSVSEDHILLKYGIFIPVRAIVELEY